MFTFVDFSTEIKGAEAKQMSLNVFKPLEQRGKILQRLHYAILVSVLHFSSKNSLEDESQPRHQIQSCNKLNSWLRFTILYYHSFLFCVVYFNQHWGAAHSKHWSKQSFLAFGCKLQKTCFLKNVAANFLLFQLFAIKTVGQAKRWSK